MADHPDPAALGTLLRHTLDLLDGDVAAVYDRLGLAGYRPRYSPFVRALVADGPTAIRDLASAVGVTHSAASQTVNQMARADLVDLRPGTDARHRIVHLTDRARRLLPRIEAEWSATAAAVAELDAELPVPLGELLTRVLEIQRERPLRTRIAAHLPPPNGEPA